LLVGDSLAVGLATPLKAELLREGVALTTEAKESTVASAWTERVRQLLRGTHFDVLFVSLGTNDCRVANSIACADFPMQARRLRDIGDAYGATVIFLIPSWLPRQWSGRIRAGIYWFDGTAIEALEILSAALSEDGIHPTRDGYAYWASEVVASWRSL
jgi:hypothetical protein